MNVPINVRNIAVAELISDGVAGVSYDKLVELAPAMQVAFSPDTSSSTLYGNGIKQVVATKVGEEEISFDVNYVTLRHLAMLGGHTYIPQDDSQNEKLIKSDADKAPYFAFFATVDGEDNTSRAVFYKKVKFQDFEQSVEQSEDSVNFSTPSLTGNAVSTSDGNVCEMIDFKPVDFKTMPDYAELFGLKITESEKYKDIETVGLDSKVAVTTKK